MLLDVVNCANRVHCVGVLELTTTGCIETSLLAEESLVVDCMAASC
jgi:hypothetical protein